jgi:hypothetical protein
MDKKSQHVGNHGGRYVDEYGHTKQFTYIDHDVKPTIRTTPPKSEAEIAEISALVKQEAEKAIAEILQFPAISAIKNLNGEYEQFVLRDEQNGITWREDMVREACMINSTLRHNLSLATWRGSVKFEHWWDDMSHEDIMAGKWKEWI